MGNPNFVSALMALALPLLALFLSRWYLVAAFLGIAAFCYTQNTSTAIFAAWAGLLVVAVYDGDRGLMVACAALLLVGLAVFFFTDDGFKELSGPRVTTWKATLAAWWDQNTLIGNGPGTWRPWWLNQISPEHWWHWKYAHNEYVQAAFELGLAGLSIVLGFLVSIFRRAWRRRNDREVVVLAGVIAALAVSCVGNFSMHLAPLAMIGLYAMGLMETKTCR
jgi:O-antigen ligase